MKKTFFSALLISFLVFCSTAHADENALSLEAGYRVDNLDWTIAPPDGPPNILSELAWKDLEIFQVKGKWVGKNNKMYVRTSVSYGWIHDGQNRDSDYSDHLGDRTIEFSRSISDSDDGFVFDASVGMGPRYRVNFSKGSIEVNPLIGASYDSQNLTMTNGTQVVSICIPDICPPPPGPFSGLDSTYEARWLGPWVGVDITGEFKGLRLWGTAEYHFLTSYDAEADWNLRTDFQHPKSFTHEADATGVVFSAGADFIITRAVSLTASFGYQEWEATDGDAVFYLSDGTTFTERFNGADWDSTELMLGVKYVF